MKTKVVSGEDKKGKEFWKDKHPIRDRKADVGSRDGSEKYLEDCSCD